MNNKEVENRENIYIKVWRFEDAPKKYQELSNNGGDEDWVALVPYALKDEYINWLEVPYFGCCCVDIYEIEEGIIYIGCHA